MSVRVRKDFCGRRKTFGQGQAIQRQPSEPIPIAIQGCTGGIRRAIKNDPKLNAPEPPIAQILTMSRRTNEPTNQRTPLACRKLLVCQSKLV